MHQMCANVISGLLRQLRRLKVVVIIIKRMIKFMAHSVWTSSTVPPMSAGPLIHTSLNPARNSIRDWTAVNAVASILAGMSQEYSIFCTTPTETLSNQLLERGVSVVLRYLFLFFSYPYDMNFHDCCQTNEFDQNGDPFNVFELYQKGQCEGLGGTIVMSEEGNPHSYVAVNALKPADTN